MSVRSHYRIPLSGAALLTVACLGTAWPASLLGGLADQPAHALHQLQLSSRLDQLRDCAGIAGRDQQVNGRSLCE